MNSAETPGRLSHHNSDDITKIVDIALSGCQSDEPLSEDPPESPTRVRFRSRVRITSGLHRHRPASNSEQDYVSFTRSSSISSGSRSSSISAPLRTQAEDEASKHGWGTLGQRVSIGKGHADRRLKLHQPRERIRALQSQRGRTPGDNEGLLRLTNERTPLSGSFLPHSYLNGEIWDREISDSTESEVEMLARETDLVFGPWPNRLFNHHWLWWHMEPLVCCLTESEEEE